jgi:RecB family endonuclease NucS
MALPTLAFAHETHIRNAYSTNLSFYRPLEALIKREVSYSMAPVRADMRTVDQDDILREWEFKLTADYSALGQILTYVALARREYKFQRQVRGVIAAFQIPGLVRETIETMNLGIELVSIPYYLCAAGNVPLNMVSISLPPIGLFIPNTNHLILPHQS